MLPPDPQFARSAVLRAFNQAQIYLFLGAAIITVGLLSACFSLLRRRFDRPLLWFALFAILYGVRLEMNYQLLWALHLPAPLLQRLFYVVGFLIPIPAFVFFRQFDLLGKMGHIVSRIVVPIAFCLAVATLLVGSQAVFFYINNAVMIGAFVLIIIGMVRVGSRSPEIVLLRRGLLVFITFALYDNIRGIFNHHSNIEPFGFVLLLASLGIIAGRRTMATEQQLTTIQKELEIAHRIQLSILPPPFPESKNFRVAARYLPMTSVAGDFYDYFLPSDHELGLLIADVSGHGIPAALIASMVKLASTTQHANTADPGHFLLGMNSVLCGNTQTQFVTAGYVYLDALAQELRYSAAAHPPMLLLRDGQVREITQNGLMLAAFDFATYATLTLPIQSGDRLVLYTDGMLEAINAQQEEFGPERLSALVRETAGLAHTEAAESILSSIQRWALSQNDDLTILLCDYVA